MNWIKPCYLVENMMNAKMVDESGKEVNTIHVAKQFKRRIDAMNAAAKLNFAAKAQLYRVREFRGI